MPQRPSPTFRYFYSSAKGPRDLDSVRANMLVPLARPDSPQEKRSGITYGAYVNTIKRAIEKDMDAVRLAFHEQAPDDGDEIRQIDIISEKHGSDYHPARIRVHGSGTSTSFVMNVALTPRGQERAEREFHILKQLSARPDPGFVPKPYLLARENIVREGLPPVQAILFLGTWFDGFHEFHLSKRPSDGSPAPVIWDLDHGTDFLSDAESEEIGRKAAFILTHYFDTETFREIFPWHHASGDFVIARREDGIRMRLVTVRQYDSRIRFTNDEPGHALTALLVFLADMTVRMRLDRLDGVGEVVWAPACWVQGAIEGFVHAMQQKVKHGGFSRALYQEFHTTIRSTSPVDLASLFGGVVESYDESAPDIPVIRENLAEHVFQVYKAIQACFADDL